MTDVSLPPGEILELIRGQARLEAKLDQFFSAQNAMKSEIDGLKTDIAAVKADLTEIKAQRRITKSYIAGVVAVVGFIAWIAGQFSDVIMKKIIG